MAKKSAVVPLHQAVPGQLVDVFALLVEKSLHTTREQKRFYLCRFRDAKRTVASTVWSDSGLFTECETEWQIGQAYKLRGKLFLDERYGPKFDVLQLRPVRAEDNEEGYHEADLLERSRFPSEQMHAELLACAEEIEDKPLRTLVCNLLSTHREALLQLPASDRRFYPFPGGWLEHTLNVAQNCRWLAARYRQYYPELSPPLNLDVLLAAAILHDLGRVQELIPSPVGAAPEPTIPGRIYGHVLLTTRLISEAAQTLPELNRDTLLLLEHLVLSHLTLPEWGSPRLPLVPEALILHHVDDLDAKMEMYVRCLTRDTTDGPFTERDPILNKPLWKGRSV